MRKLTGVFLLVLVALVLLAIKAGAAPPDDVTICHKEGDKWSPIAVSFQGWKNGHEGHGDWIIDRNHPCPPSEDGDPAPIPAPQNSGTRLFLPAVLDHACDWISAALCSPSPITP